jgi:hypothetical protein
MHQREALAVSGASSRQKRLTRSMLKPHRIALKKLNASAVCQRWQYWSLLQSGVP